MRLPEINFGISAGKIVEETGRYRVHHEANHTNVTDIVCIKGDVLPPCKKCGTKVRFILQERLTHASQCDQLESLPEAPPKT